MKLLNSERALIDPQKLTGYSLDPEHDEGRHKAQLCEWILRTGEDFPRLVTCYIL